MPPHKVVRCSLPFTRAPHLLLGEFYDFALSAPAALSLEATNRVASSWLFRFTCQTGYRRPDFYIKIGLFQFQLKKRVLRGGGEEGYGLNMDSLYMLKYTCVVYVCVGAD